jgi:hypothetical protein
MKFRVEVICLDGTGQEQRHPVLTMEREDLVMETLGLNLSEGKALLASVQEVMVAQQTQDYLQQQRTCSDCGQLHTSKDVGATPIKTVFGPVQGGQSALEPLLLSEQWSEDISAHARVAPRTN